MSRPLALCLVLLVLIITSQSEWKQQSKSEMELTAAITKQSDVSNKKEVIKEQIILSQEKRIYILTELVKTLQQQLAQCQEMNSDNTTEIIIDRITEAVQPGEGV